MYDKSWNGLLVDSVLKRVQVVTVTIAANQTTGTTTISAIDLANTWPVLLGQESNTGSATPDGDAYAYAQITNATTVTATRLILNATQTATIKLLLLEFWPGFFRTIQQGVVTLTSVASATATVALTRTDKYWLAQLGTSNNFTGAQPSGAALCDVTLTNGTTVTGTRGTSANTAAVAFALGELAA